MNITNWLTAGRTSKKNINVIANLHCNPKGRMGNSHWDDYIQITFYSKEKEKFIRLNMTKEEGKRFNEKLTKGLLKFN